MKINLGEIMEKENLPPSRVPKTYVVNELKKLGFQIDDANREVVNLVLSYFLRDPEFLESKLVTSENSFHKGLLIHGDVGIGKSMLFDCLYIIGRKLIIDRGISDLYFPKISAIDFVNNFMEDTTVLIKAMYKGKLYIDDLASERKAFNSVELFEDILFQRNRNEAVTFATTNLKPSAIALRYGDRVGDRLPQLFNIIKWSGESRRK